MKKTLLSVIVSVTFGLFVVMTLFASTGSSDDFKSSQLQMALRKIGHELLLSSGDSTSRVMPVRKTSDDTYEITFEKEWKFIPDSIYAVIEKHLGAIDMNSRYLVNVITCGSSPLVVYGYEYNSKYKSPLACSGRIQPIGCQKIQIMFQKEDESTWIYTSACLIALSFAIAFVFIVPARKRKNSKLPSEPTGIQFGKFSYSTGMLTINGEVVELSDKEEKILAMLIAARNELVLRDDLTKQIWENDGVIVGRSLDVFISRLRKILQKDETVSIINVHGKGYKLVCEE